MMKCSNPMIYAAWIVWAAFAGVQNDPVLRLKEELDRESNIGLFDLIPLAIDAGPAAVPYLKQVLLSNDEQKQNTSAALLAYLGGDEAIVALREAPRAESKIFHWALCSAVASRGNQKDVQFLTNALLPDTSHDWWEARMTAAFSLGILRANEAINALESVARNADVHEMHGDAAKDAIFWIHGKPVSVIDSDIALPDRDIIAAIFVNGIPRTRDVLRLHDGDRHGVWIRNQNLWTFHQGDKGEPQYPSISFNIHLSPDGNRALVVMDVGIENMNGSIYNCILQKTNSIWKIWSISLKGGY